MTLQRLDAVASTIPRAEHAEADSPAQGGSRPVLSVALPARQPRLVATNTNGLAVPGPGGGFSLAAARLKALTEIADATRNDMGANWDLVRNLFEEDIQRAQAELDSQAKLTRLT